MAWTGKMRLPGLSPRLRGNQVSAEFSITLERSIPAPAGEPYACFLHGHSVMVYPRACGGTLLPTNAKSIRHGLSPRLRGNPSISPCRLSVSGSIPAPAGEPQPRLRLQNWRRVYPRACGGTSYSTSHYAAATGLSPRLRGNLFVKRPTTIYYRSIPAPAGEPRCHYASLAV